MKPSTKILFVAIPTVLAVSAALAAPPEGTPAAAAAHRTSIQRVGEEVRETTPEGRVHSQETTRLEIEGLGGKDLQGTIEDDPASLGGMQKATITDTADGQSVVFSYDPGTNAITIEAGGSSTSITQNPDHSYSVDGDAAADGAAAVALLDGKDAWASASPHAVMLAYSYAHLPSMAYKDTQNTATGATPPAVCSLFDDFCEAAACAKTGGCDE